MPVVNESRVSHFLLMMGYFDLIGHLTPTIYHTSLHHLKFRQQNHRPE